jgi:hypothetical protein
MTGWDWFLGSFDTFEIGRPGMFYKTLISKHFKFDAGRTGSWH